MSGCTLKERMPNFAIGIGLAVILLGLAWVAVVLTWSVAPSTSTLNYASNHTGQRMAARFVDDAADDANSPVSMSMGGR